MPSLSGICPESQQAVKILAAVYRAKPFIRVQYYNLWQDTCELQLKRPCLWLEYK